MKKNNTYTQSLCFRGVGRSFNVFCQAFCAKLISCIGTVSIGLCVGHIAGMS